MQKRMLPLKALKPHLYGTRRMEAGDEYEAPTEEAIALVANGRAGFAKARKPAPANQPAPPVRPPPPLDYEPASPAEPEQRSAPELSIDDLRLQATQLGIDVDGRWGVHRLRYEIEQASRS